jgi:uncharacterized membrane protein YgcG
MKHSNKSLFQRHFANFYSKIIMSFIFLFLCAIIYVEFFGLFPFIKDVILVYGPELDLDSVYELKIESATKSENLLVNMMDGESSSNIGTNGSGSGSGSGSGNGTGSGGTGSGGTGSGTSVRPGPEREDIAPQGPDTPGRLPVLEPKPIFPQEP